jgi:acyl-CoA reductase-like NAD-dependent aldehyde dehydrogenase
MATKPLIQFSPAVSSFLSDSPFGLFIDGRWTPSAERKTLWTVDPGSGERLAEFHNAGAEDVDAAVRAARRAFRESPWARMTPNERGVYLHRLADLVEKHRETIAEIESLDVGKPLSQAYWDVDHFCSTMRYFIELSKNVSYREPIAVSHHEARIVRHPRGVCGFIIPWNFPFTLVGWGISPALAAGNTVVIKQAEDTPLSTLFLTRLIKEAGIPDGVINVLTGLGETAGAALAQHRGLDRMSFTGSPEVGRLVAESCGRNLVPVKLELGGKGAAVVFEDVDVDSTVDTLVRAVTLNAGQVCCTATRWVIQDRIYDQFAEKTIQRMKQVKVGYWDDPKTEMGPVVSSKQLDRVLGYLERGRQEGAELLLEGGRADVADKGGFYVKPAVLAGSPENVAARDEIFGPVPFLLRFKTEDEAVDVVNRSRYGLANSVWSSDLSRANRVAEDLIAGSSWINGHNIFVHGVPYAGVNLSGMGGGTLALSTYMDYLRDQSVVRSL